VTSEKDTLLSVTEYFTKHCEEYEEDPNVEDAEPNFVIKLNAVPNDSYYQTTGSWKQIYPDLWGIKKINPEPAWDQTTGSTSIVVADIDTGVDRNHEDIKNNPELAQGIHVGFREFDRITNGLQESELLLIGGESSSGKSTFAMNMALNAWRGKNKIPDTVEEFTDNFDNSGKNVLVLTIEMPFDSFRRRADSCIAGIPLYGLRDGTLNSSEIEKFKASLLFQEHYPKEFKIVDIPRGCTIQQIESKFLETCYDYVPDLILIDYISLMTPDENHGSDWLNLGRLAEQVHEFTRTYTSRVISPVQLNRPPKNGDNGSADQHRVGRSIMLPQNANIVLNIETRKDEELRPDMIVRIAKMRDGEKGSFVLHKRFDIMRVYDDIPGWTPQTYNSDDEED